MNRKEYINEVNTRKALRKAISEHHSNFRKQKYNEILVEECLRKVIRKILHEAKIADKVPHTNTGINVLQDLLKKIIKILEMGYKTLTTDEEQRKSFRSHILSAIMNSIAPPRSLKRADIEDLTGYKSDDLNSLEFEDSPEGDIGDGDLNVSLEKEDEILQEGVSLNEIIRLLEADIEVDIDEDEEDLTDPIKSRSGEEGIVDIDEEPKPEVEVDPKDEFGLDSYTKDLTGRNIAYETFQKIENNIIDSYNLLSNEEDSQMFYTYLLVNIMLYFDRFEEELQGSLETPTVYEYQNAKQEEAGIDNPGIELNPDEYSEGELGAGEEFSEDPSLEDELGIEGL